MIGQETDHPPVDAPTLRFKVVGGFEATLGDRRLTRADWQRVSAERLVKLLLATPGHRLSREVVAETLWPGADPDTSRPNLRKALHFANLALQGTGAIAAADGWAALDPARIDVDLDRLNAALDVLASPADGGDGTLDHAMATVLDLGSSDLLPDDGFEDWLAAPRERLRARWQLVALGAARRAHADGRQDAALELVGQLLERDPTDEAAHRIAIQVYAAEGRHHAARRQFELCRRALRDGLDADPSAETIDAFRAAERTATMLPGRAAAEARLVARKRELELMEPLLDRVAGGSLASLVIRGPAGIGKTRLLREVELYARAAGWRVLEWRATGQAATLAYAPVRTSLSRNVTAEEVGGWPEPSRSALATLVPELAMEPQLTFAESAAFVAALVHGFELLAGGGPAALIVDDLPQLDPSSIDLLAALVAGLPDVPLLVAASYRDEEPVSAAVADVVSRVRRTGGLEMRLGPLALRDVERLVVGHVGGESVQPELARALHERSLGNPLFCLELIRAGSERGAVRLEGGRWTIGATGLTGEAPASVRALVAIRSARLPADARETLAIAAELGPVFQFDTLAAVRRNDDERLLAALDAALASGLLVEAGAGYAFAHPLYRLAVRGAWGSRRRGEAHRAIARALAGPIDDDTSPEVLERAARDCVDPLTVAENAFAACELGVGAANLMAVAFGFAAGERANRMLDRDGAASLFARALARWRALPPGLAVRFDSGAACVAAAEIEMTEGRETAAAALFREAAEWARTPAEVARAYTRFHWLPYRHGDFEAARAILEEGLARLPPDATAARARVRRDIGWCLARLRQQAEAFELLQDATAILVSEGDRYEAMKALDLFGALHSQVGRPDEAAVHLERSLSIALELHDSQGEVHARLHLGTAFHHAGHAARGWPHLRRAIDLARHIGDRYVESVASWSSARTLDALGDLSGAAELRRRELALLESLGGNPHNEALAHAHLACLGSLGVAGIDVAGEASAARRLASSSADPGYPTRIERALSARDWSEVDT